MSTIHKSASPVLVILAYAAVYIVWGSTYFFIARAVAEFPPFLLGAIRFLAAGILMGIYCAISGEQLFGLKNLWQVWLTGFLLLFLGNGIVIWVEQYIASGVVAITVSSAPLWFILLDYPKWGQNFKSRSILAGLIMGLVGVGLLFSDQVKEAFQGEGSVQTGAMLFLLVGSISWAAGSLFSKYKAAGGSTVANTTWQMLFAGFAFIPGVLIRGELDNFSWSAVSSAAWIAIIYLIIFGSIVAYSAYLWLLKVRPAVQVSTYAYVNPVVAVLLGIFFADEEIGTMQIIGLLVILGSVLLINLARYRSERKAEKTKPI